MEFMKREQKQEPQQQSQQLNDNKFYSKYRISI